MLVQFGLVMLASSCFYPGALLALREARRAPRPRALSRMKLRLPPFPAPLRPLREPAAHVARTCAHTRFARIAPRAPAASVGIWAALFDVVAIVAGACPPPRRRRRGGVARALSLTPRGQSSEAALFPLACLPSLSFSLSLPRSLSLSLSLSLSSSPPSGAYNGFLEAYTSYYLDSTDRLLKVCNALSLSWIPLLLLLLIMTMLRIILIMTLIIIILILYYYYYY